MADILSKIFNKIRQTSEWPLIISPFKKVNFKLCRSYSTISPVSQSTKVMFKVILQRLKPQIEEVIAEEQADRVPY